MEAIVSSTSRFFISKDHKLWTTNQEADYNFWCRYLDVYDGIKLVVRAKKVDSPPDGAFLASGEGIEPILLPYYQGVGAFARVFHRVYHVVKTSLESPCAIQVRLPCPIGGLFAHLVTQGRPFGAEIVGDPWDVFSKNVFRHPIRPLIQLSAEWSLRRICRKAHATAYVTTSFLQSRYPPGKECFTTSFSSLSLDKAEFAKIPRSNFNLKSPLFISVGHMEVAYKGMDILIRAFHAYFRRCFGGRLVIIGEGRLKPGLQILCNSLGIGDKVTFTGMLPKHQVFEWFRKADMLIMASLSEGLPRAILEGMSQGLPCIGTEVGGIPEILCREDIVPPGDFEKLSNKMVEVTHDPIRLKNMSLRNLCKAKDFEASTLREKRKSFYGHVRNLTTHWLRFR